MKAKKKAVTAAPAAAASVATLKKGDAVRVTVGDWGFGNRGTVAWVSGNRVGVMMETDKDAPGAVAEDFAASNVLPV